MNRPEVLTRRCRMADTTTMPHGSMCITHWSYASPGESVCYFGEGIAYADALEALIDTAPDPLGEALVYERGYDDGWNAAIAHVVAQMAKLSGK